MAPGNRTGFAVILIAQFLSALADNSLLIAAIALLREHHAPAEYTPILNSCFVVAYIVLAPVVGALADAFPKGRVMMAANAVKFAGCAAMLAGLNPLVAYAIVGTGAAAYAPAKYGILTEYLPREKLVMANGWMEGLTVCAIIFGTLAGGVLSAPSLTANWLIETPLPRFGIDSAAKFEILVIAVLYIAAAVVNAYIPRLPIDHKLPSVLPWFVVKDYARSFWQLWRDPLGQISLAVTSLFWGVGATLKLIVIEWADAALNYDVEHASRLMVWFALGIAAGSVIAAKFVRLQDAVRLTPLGIAMGLAVLPMVVIRDPVWAIVLLIFIGTLAGLFIVPMNALLQDRGHAMMGAGHSIAVQNFNENLSILTLLGVYALMLKADISIYLIVVWFSLFVSTTMWYLHRKHRGDRVT